MKKDAKSRLENVLNQLIEEQNELNPAAKDDGSSNSLPQSEMPSTTSQSRQPSHNRTPISGQRPPRHSPGPSHPQLSPSRLPLLQSQPIQTHTENMLHDPDAVFEPSASIAHWSRADHNYMPFTPFELNNLQNRNSLLSPRSLSNYQSVHSIPAYPFCNNNRRSESSGWFMR